MFKFCKIPAISALKNNKFKFHPNNNNWGLVTLHLTKYVYRVEGIIFKNSFTNQKLEIQYSKDFCKFRRKIARP